MVNDWGGTFAQLNCNVQLSDVVNANNIPTLADVSRSFDNSTSIGIITAHLQSVLRYSGVELTDAQLGETALAILSGYWYLNLAELCVFFCQLKNGSRGQFVWGSRINNQAIMVALADFCKDRRREIERNETIKLTKAMERGYSRVEDSASAMIAGTMKFREELEEAKKDFGKFCSLFPFHPDNYKHEVWWGAFKGDEKCLQMIYGIDIPSHNTFQDDIGKYLCDYNISIKNRENEKI